MVTLLLSLALCVGWAIRYREDAWPWTDRDPRHGWFHCLNETSMPIAWGWRHRGIDGWNFVDANHCDGGPEAASWQAADELDGMLPVPTGVIEVRIWFPPESGVPPASTSFAAHPGLHVRLRVDADHRAFLACGTATSIGYATFDAERQVSGS